MFLIKRESQLNHLCSFFFLSSGMPWIWKEFLVTLNIFAPEMDLFFLCDFEVGNNDIPETAQE